MRSNVILWILLSAAAQGQDRILDLTRNVADETKLSIDQQFSYRRSCPGHGEGRLGQAPSFSLTIEKLDSAEYSMGGLIISDLRLTNTGQEALAFPWVLRHEFGQDEDFSGTDAVQVALGLSIVDAGREQTLTGTILRGSLARTETTQAIAPGDSIRIRLPAAIPIIDSPFAPVTGDAQVFATLIVSDGDCRTLQPVRSRRVNIRWRGRD